MIFEERKTEVEEFRKRISRAQVSNQDQSRDRSKPGKYTDRDGKKRRGVFTNPFMRRSESNPTDHLQTSDTDRSDNDMRKEKTNSVATTSTTTSAPSGTLHNKLWSSQ